MLYTCINFICFIPLARIQTFKTVLISLLLTFLISFKKLQIYLTHFHCQNQFINYLILFSDYIKNVIIWCLEIYELTVRCKQDVCI